MWSNGLGVCRIPNAGSRSICKNRTIAAIKPPVTIRVSVILSNPPVLSISSNIGGATISLVGRIGGLPVADIPFDPASPKSIGGMKNQSLTLAANPSAFGHGILLDRLMLTFTGGSWVPTGWKGHTTTTVSIPDFVIDEEAPTFDSGIVHGATPTKITLTFSETLKVTNIQPSEFGIGIDGSVVAPDNAIVINGSKTIELTITNAIVPGQVVTVGYTKGGTVAYHITDIHGNAVATFGGGKAAATDAVTNATAAPLFNSGVTASSLGNTKVAWMIFTENVKSKGGQWNMADFGVNVAGDITNPISIFANGNVLEMWMAVPFLNGQAVSVGYTKSLTNSAGWMVDYENNPVLDFGGGAAGANELITNNITNPTEKAGEVTDAETSLIIIIFDRPLGAMVQSVAGDFGIKVDTVLASISVVYVVDGKLHLTLTNPITNAQVVTVGYTNNNSTDLWDIDGNYVQTFGGGHAAATDPIINRIGVPIFESGYVPKASPHLILIKFTKDLLPPGDVSSANFVAEVASISATLRATAGATYIRSDGLLVLTLDTAVTNGQTVEIGYTSPGGTSGISGSDGPVADFTLSSTTGLIKNNVAV